MSTRMAALGQSLHMDKQCVAGEQHAVCDMGKRACVWVVLCNMWIWHVHASRLLRGWKRLGQVIESLSFWPCSQN